MCNRTQQLKQIENSSKLSVSVLYMDRHGQTHPQNLNPAQNIHIFLICYSAHILGLNKAFRGISTLGDAECLSFMFKASSMCHGADTSRFADRAKVQLVHEDLSRVMEDILS